MEKYTVVKNKYLKDWKSNGHKTTAYVCKHCNKHIETAEPDKDMCNDRGFWDSVKICIHCNKLNFVVVYPTGKTKAIKI